MTGNAAQVAFQAAPSLKSSLLAHRLVKPPKNLRCTLFHILLAFIAQHPAHNRLHQAAILLNGLGQALLRLLLNQPQQALFIICFLHSCLLAFCLSPALIGRPKQAQIFTNFLHSCLPVVCEAYHKS